MTKPPLLIKGMHGLGDNLHQRAIIAQLAPHYDLWLESSWVEPYADFEGLKIIRKQTPLRTQSKNAFREASKFMMASPPHGIPQRLMWYRPEEVRARGGVLAAMCGNAGVDYARADFRLPVWSSWAQRADELIATWHNPDDKPLLVYRPLVERTEWSGCKARNPDTAHYNKIFASIREKFFVASIADLVDGVEWSVSGDISADVTLHNGELDFAIMAALFARAALVFCSPGFAVILAQAVETPVICTFGRYERAYSFSGGARLSPYLGIEPIKPCDDFSHDIHTDKSIDLSEAIPRAIVFASQSTERQASRLAGIRYLRSE